MKGCVTIHGLSRRRNRTKTQDLQVGRGRNSDFTERANKRLEKQGTLWFSHMTGWLLHAIKYDCFLMICLYCKPRLTFAEQITSPQQGWDQLLVIALPCEAVTQRHDTELSIMCVCVEQLLHWGSFRAIWAICNMTFLTSEYNNSAVIWGQKLLVYKL